MLKRNPPSGTGPPREAISAVCQPDVADGKRHFDTREARGSKYDSETAKDTTLSPQSKPRGARPPLLDIVGAGWPRLAGRLRCHQHARPRVLTRVRSVLPCHGPAVHAAWLIRDRAARPPRSGFEDRRAETRPPRPRPAALEVPAVAGPDLHVTW